MSRRSRLHPHLHLQGCHPLADSACILRTILGTAPYKATVVHRQQVTFLNKGWN